MTTTFFTRLTLLLALIFVLAACQSSPLGDPLPTAAVAAAVPDTPDAPPTFTPQPTSAAQEREIATSAPPPTRKSNLSQSTTTPLPIPTNTPVTPSPTPTPTITPTLLADPTATPEVKPIDEYAYGEVIPYEAFPVPPNNNGWGMHWMANTSQEPGVVDRFVNEVVKMNIKWVVFLNGGSDIGANDYLVDKLVANNIMPVMRLYQPTIEPYGDVTAMVRHYRARGVYYYQIYNEPNVNIENRQAFANPNQYATAWAATARQVISAGGLPGIGAFSPGGEYDHNEFLERTLDRLAYNDDLHLLNHAWLSVHNYHGTRAYDDPGGFFLYRRYNDIVVSRLGRSLPIVGTEAGSYHTDPAVELQFIRFQYDYMKYNREPYFLAFSWWLLANREGGHYDDAWEWQALFKEGGYVHPAVTEYFYKG